MKVLRIDDLLVLYAQIQELGIQKIIDQTITPHGNWSGISIGHLISLWLCYLLSESDHRLSSVEAWADSNLILLGTLSGQFDISSKDFTDDRLEQSLDYLSKESNWLGISNELNARSLQVYDLDRSNTVRLDAAPMQGHHKVKESGLFQYGYGKHHDSRLGMLKIMLACVDNEVNGFAYPLAHITVSGEQADDGLYIPLIAQCEQTFRFSGNSNKKLYVGDGKMGSKENRNYIVKSGNDYLLPLSKIQLSAQQRNKIINEVASSKHQKVYKKDKSGEQLLVAQGFEQEATVKYLDSQGNLAQWQERQIFVLSTAYATAQKKGLETRLAKAEEELKELLVSKQGKQIPKTREELDKAIEKILGNKLRELLKVEIEEQMQEKKIRAYKDRPARIEHFSTFELNISRQNQAIEAHKATLGWQVYATTASKQSLDFEKCVWKYRYQNRVERRFDDLRNKVVPLVPIFVNKDNRVEALVNLLMICLKICSVIEYKVSKQLQIKGEELDSIYEGNPKRATARPTAKRILKAFKNISLVIMSNPNHTIPIIQMTDLEKVQLKIIDLLGFESTLYTELYLQIKLFFSHKKFSEI